MYSSKKTIIFSAIISICVMFTSGCKNRYEDLNLSVYQYRDTKELVRFGYKQVMRGYLVWHVRILRVNDNNGLSKKGNKYEQNEKNVNMVRDTYH